MLHSCPGVWQWCPIPVQVFDCDVPYLSCLRCPIPIPVFVMSHSCPGVWWWCPGFCDVLSWCLTAVPFLSQCLCCPIPDLVFVMSHSCSGFCDVPVWCPYSVLVFVLSDSCSSVCDVPFLSWCLTVLSHSCASVCAVPFLTWCLWCPTHVPVFEMSHSCPGVWLCCPSVMSHSCPGVCAVPFLSQCLWCPVSAPVFDCALPTHRAWRWPRKKRSAGSFTPSFTRQSWTTHCSKTCWGTWCRTTSTLRPMTSWLTAMLMVRQQGFHAGNGIDLD